MLSLFLTLTVITASLLAIVVVISEYKDKKHSLPQSIKATLIKDETHTSLFLLDVEIPATHKPINFKEISVTNAFVTPAEWRENAKGLYYFRPLYEPKASTLSINIPMHSKLEGGDSFETYFFVRKIKETEDVAVTLTTEKSLFPNSVTAKAFIT